MKLIEKLAIEAEEADATQFGDEVLLYGHGFEAGFRKARELILNNPEWGRTNWIEARKEAIAALGEEEA